MGGHCSSLHGRCVASLYGTLPNLTHTFECRLREAPLLHADEAHDPLLPAKKTNRNDRTNVCPRNSPPPPRSHNRPSRSIELARTARTCSSKDLILYMSLFLPRSWSSPPSPSPLPSSSAAPPSPSPPSSDAACADRRKKRSDGGPERRGKQAEPSKPEKATLVSARRDRLARTDRLTAVKKRERNSRNSRLPVGHYAFTLSILAQGWP